jgi:hypothetical protein
MTKHELAKLGLKFWTTSVQRAAISLVWLGTRHAVVIFIIDAMNMTLIKVVMTWVCHSFFDFMPINFL